MLSYHMAKGSLEIHALFTSAEKIRVLLNKECVYCPFLKFNRSFPLVLSHITAGWGYSPFVAHAHGSHNGLSPLCPLDLPLSLDVMTLSSYRAANIVSFFRNTSYKFSPENSAF